MHVLDADIDPFFHNTPINELVDNNTNGSLGDVEHDASTSLVEFVRHTLVNGSVNLNVDIVSNLVQLHVTVEWNYPVLPESFAEKVSGSCTVTMGVGHLARSWKIPGTSHNSVNTTKTGQRPQ